MKTQSRIILTLLVLGCLLWLIGEQSVAAQGTSKFIKMQQDVYSSDQVVLVEFSGLPGNQQDWITVVKKGAADNSFGTYFYTQGKTAGNHEFKGLAPGEYEVRVYFDWPDGGYTVQDRLGFTVTAAAEPAPEQEQSTSEMKSGYDPIVERVQLELTALGYDPGPIDGKMGKKTAEALKQYQAENELEATGEPDEATLKEFKIEPPALDCSSYSCTVKNGLTDEMLAQIKQHLSDNEKVDDVILKNPTNTDLKKLPEFMNEQLVELMISSSKYVTDITPLGALPHLKSRLTLEYLANLSDLTPLGNLKELKDVTLRRLGEPVTIAPLSSFANLEKLTLSELNKNIDDVFDISPLSGKLLLKNVTFYGTKIKDLSPLQDSVDMERLYFDYIAAEDLSPLKGFKKLTYLLLGDMPATDLSAVGELTALTHFSVGAVDVTDLSFLSSLKALKYLTFNNIPAKDMTPVGDLTDLRTIDLYKTSFDDYAPLAKCTTLEKLTARYDGEHFDNLDVIRSMPNIKQVWVDGAPNVQAWEALGTAVNLESLSANRTSFSDLGLLADKVKLESVYFDECTVTHPEALVSLPKLRYFGMKKTQGIEDIRLFRNLWTIDTVSIYYTKEDFPQEQIDELEQAIEVAKKLQKIFDEQFYNNNNEWVESSSEDSELQVADGQYLFEHKKDDASWMSWNDVAVDYAQNFSIEAAVEKIHGPENSGYGLIWGLEDTKNRYQFLVNGNGAYTYAKTVDGNWEVVIDWTESSFINTGNAANILSVRRLGDDVQLYINYRYVATVPFEHTFGPNAGFFVHGPTKVGIDYLLVKGTKIAE